MNQMDLLNLCHQQAHRAEHDFEDTVFVSLTRRDIWLILFSTLLVSLSVNCLDDECADLSERLAEVIEVQKDNWQTGLDETPEA